MKILIDIILRVADNSIGYSELMSWLENHKNAPRYKPQSFLASYIILLSGKRL